MNVSDQVYISRDMEHLEEAWMAYGKSQNQVGQALMEMHGRHFPKRNVSFSQSSDYLVFGKER